MRCDPSFCPSPCFDGTCGVEPAGTADACNQPDADFRLMFQAEPFAVRQALRTAIARFARRMRADEAGTLELVLAEVFNNIVEHAYEERHEGLIELRIERRSRGLVCGVADLGKPMPGGVLPAGAAPALVGAGAGAESGGGTSPDIDGLPEGGFGWFLIRDLTRNLTYRREGTVNRLNFVMPLQGG